jgi:hypothetical protein
VTNLYVTALKTVAGGNTGFSTTAGRSCPNSSVSHEASDLQGFKPRHRGRLPQENGTSQGQAPVFSR